MRIRLVAASKRSGHLPGVPSAAEAGLPGLEGDLTQVIASPAFRTRVETQGADVVSSNPRELAVFLQEQLANHRKPALAAGIRAE